MPRTTLCSFSHCAQDLVGRSRLNKIQANHVRTYHADIPVRFVCIYTDLPRTFLRQASNDMDYVCLCAATFTASSSLRRHYEKCGVAATTTLSSRSIQDGNAEDMDNGSSSDRSDLITISDVALAPPSRRDRPLTTVPYEPMRQSSRPGRTSRVTHVHPQEQSGSAGASRVSSRRPPQEERSLEQASTPFPTNQDIHQIMLEQHHHHLQAASVQHSQMLHTITENHRLFDESAREQQQRLMKTMTDSATEQSQLMRDTFSTLIRSTAEQQRQVLESISGHIDTLLDAQSVQHRQMLHYMSEQHRKLLQTATEQHTQLVNITTDYHRDSLDSTSFQHGETIRAIEDICEQQRENTYMLASHDRVLDQLTMYNHAQQKAAPGLPIAELPGDIADKAL